MNATRHAPTPLVGLKTPVLILKLPIAKQLRQYGLNSVREYLKGGAEAAMNKLLETLREDPQATVIFPRSAIGKSDILRATVRRTKEDFPACRIIVLRDGHEDTDVSDNDQKAGADAVLWYTGNTLGEAGCKQIATFVQTGVLPKTEQRRTDPSEPSTGVARGTIPWMPKPAAKPRGSLSNQELFEQVLSRLDELAAQQAAQHAAVMARLNQIHGLASGQAAKELRGLMEQVDRLVGKDALR